MGSSGASGSNQQKKLGQELCSRGYMNQTLSWLLVLTNGKDGASITDPSVLPMSMQQHSQITPPLPTSVQDSRQSRNRMRRSESTSLLTILKSTTNPSGWEISDVPSSRPNLMPLDLMGSTTIYWNISLRTHWKSSKISWITSGPQTSRTIGEQPLWSPSLNQTRAMLTQTVTDQLRCPVACARS